jgi:hypothetical protein
MGTSRQLAKEWCSASFAVGGHALGACERAVAPQACGLRLIGHIEKVVRATSIELMTQIRMQVRMITFWLPRTKP